ncbi:putative transport protein [Candidatus Blochmanniella pennsylvanica str. BPEN]|uniref:Membrane protein n=2 Tax=Candidatus Blochmanniella TaxID=203804 RepID=A0ABN4AYD0_9ENTR|nr:MULTISPECIES: Bax inhibitor-1/YccA family protein [Blochmannia]AAZ40978.1 putative transport protein [Candidatus Blochmannia pennsylvanicus str. BPEN]AGC03621.1 putative membrane protein [Candidatus Blochmannia chromaiodes str. 640]UOY04200.1 Bax inhibitor-1/YccA family protein [Candidatus Blochmannia pennsylvanicus]
MDQFPRFQNTASEQVNNAIQPYILQVFGWMSCGLLLTAFVAWYASRTPAILQLLFSNQIIFFSLIIGQLALVFVLSGMVTRLSGSLATTLFMLYSMLTGLTLSSVFILYTTSSISSAFVVTSGMFGAMTLYGYTTKRDLSSFGNLLFMALIGIVLASMVNLWLKNTALMWLITYIGVIIFVGLTAYDTQKLKSIGASLSIDNQDQFRKYSIIGALTLYLDFINLFLMIVRIFGNRR